MASDDEKEKGKSIEVIEPADESEDEPAEPDDEEALRSVDEADNDEKRPPKDDEPSKDGGKVKRFFRSYWRKKIWTIPLTILVLIGLIFLIPATRYPVLAAMDVKRQFTVVVDDSKTHTPVSDAKVTLDGTTVMTDKVGGAKFNAKVGDGTLKVEKQYYESLAENVFVGVSHNTTNVRSVNLVATGRQVPVSVVNKISGKPVSNATVKVLDTSATTDSSGKANIVLPTQSQNYKATIIAAGYHNLSGTVQVTDSMVEANTFELTPNGRVYFLSDQSGNIDVVSTNLDGSTRKTVLAGTGNEDLNNTILLAARDWKYLALLSKRDGNKEPKLYLISTANNNQLTTIDGANASITPIGWSGHYFIYQANPDDVKSWQPGSSLLKSYDADTGKTATIDQTTASGNQYSYTYQQFGYGDTIIGNDGKVIYVKNWDGGPNGNSLAGESDQILSAAQDGTDKQVLLKIPITQADGYQSVNALVYSPGTVWFQDSNNSGTTYYVYQNGSVSQSNTVTDAAYQKAQQNNSTYLLSPTGNQSLWAAQRDGKNTLFVGDANGGNGKQIAALSDYTSYGWFTDNYLLVEKGGSELYIMAPTPGAKALKISDYYKPPRSFYGYGGL